MKRAVLSIALLLGHVPALRAAPPAVTPSVAVAGTHTCPYPEAARRDDVQGDVLIGYDVDADGGIVHVVLVKSSGFAVLDKAALGCVSSRWQNIPATQDGIKIASSNHTALVRYKLSGDTVPKGAIRAFEGLIVFLVLVWVVLRWGFPSRRRE